MKIVNALISVCLLSHVFMCNSASVIAERNLRTSEEELKGLRDNIELSGQLEALKLIFSDKKKTGSADSRCLPQTIPEPSKCPSENPTTPTCKPDKKISTRKKSTVKNEVTVTHKTKDIDTFNNRWKKIQNFFFRASTSWPFTKSDKSMRETMVETRWYIQDLKPGRLKAFGQGVDGTTVIRRTYIRPIPDAQRNGKEERVLVKEEIIRDKNPDNFQTTDGNENAFTENSFTENSFTENSFTENSFTENSFTEKASTDNDFPDLDGPANEDSSTITITELTKPQIDPEECTVSTVDQLENISQQKWIIQEQKLPSGHKVVEYQKLPSGHQVILSAKIPPKYMVIENPKPTFGLEMTKNERMTPKAEAIENEILLSGHEPMQNEKSTTENDLAEISNWPLRYDFQGNLPSEVTGSDTISTYDLMENEKFPYRHELTENEKSSTENYLMEIPKSPFGFDLLGNEKWPPRHNVMENEMLPSRHEGPENENENSSPKNDPVENEKLPSSHEETENENLPSKHEPMEIEELPPRYELPENENEKSAPRQDGVEDEKFPSRHVLTENENSPPKYELIEDEKSPSRHDLEENEKLPSRGEENENENPPSRHELTENEKLPFNIDLMDNEMLPCKEIKPEDNSFTADSKQFPESDEINHFNDDPEVTVHLKESDQAPTPEADPEVSLNPEPLMGLEQIRTPESRNNQIEKLGVDQKFVFMHPQKLENNYFNNEKNHFTGATVPSKASSTVYSDSQPKETNRGPNEYHYKIPNESKIFLSIFNNFLRNSFPDILNQHVEILQSKILDQDFYRPTAKTSRNYKNPGQGTVVFQTKNHWQTNRPNPTMVFFRKPTYNDFTSKGRDFINETPKYKITKGPRYRQTYSNLDRYGVRHNTTGYQQDEPQQNKFMYPMMYHSNVITTMNDKDSDELSNQNQPMQNENAAFTTAPLIEYSAKQFISKSPMKPEHIDNLWNWKKIDSDQVLFSSTTDSQFSREFYNDNIDYEDSHEFNSEHHSTFNNEQTHSADRLTDWIPLNFSPSGDEANTTSAKINDSPDEKTSSISIFNILNKDMLDRTPEVVRAGKKLTFSPNNFGFLLDDFLFTDFLNFPVKNLEKVTQTYDELTRSQAKYGRIPSKLEKSREDSMLYGSRKESSIKNYPMRRETKSPLFGEMFFDNLFNDTGRNHLLKSFSEHQSKSPKNNLLDKEEKKIIQSISNVTENDLVDFYKSSDDDMNVIQAVDHYTEFYNNVNFKNEGGQNSMSITPWPNVQFKNNNFDEAPKKINDQMSYPYLEKMDGRKYQLDPSTRMINDKYAHDTQNTKFTPATNRDSLAGEFKNTVPLNPFIFLEQLINQSIPQTTNQTEISSVQMSLVKIVRKIPEILNRNKPILASDLLAPFQRVISRDSNNNKEVKDRLDPLLSKIHSALDKIVAENNKKKRDLSGMADNIEMFVDKNNEDPIIQYKIPDNNLIGDESCLHNEAEIFHNLSETLPHAFNNEKNGNISVREAKHNKTVIGNRNENINLQHDFSETVKEETSKLSAYNNLEHLGNPHEPMNQFLVAEDNLDDKKRSADVNTKKIKKRNILGSKNMKSSELQFIVDKNLPALPLNKAQFINYMITGKKQPRQEPVLVEEGKNKILSKSNLQKLIDRNTKKQFMSADNANKRNRKKEWQNKL